MKAEEVSEWLNSALSAMKKRSRDDTVTPPSEERSPRKRRKTSNISRADGSKPSRFKRSRSDGDITSIRGQQRSNRIDYRNMANIPPSPNTSSSAMPPPSRPSTRSSSRRRSQITAPESIITSQATYRSEVLEPNCIFIECTNIPTDVRAAAEDVLNAEELGQPLDEAEARRIVTIVKETVNENEDHVLSRLGNAIFRMEDTQSGNLLRGDKAPFVTDAVPHFHPPKMFALKQPAVSNPVPDILYGYPSRAFESQQGMAQKSIDQGEDCLLSNTTRVLFWGFLVVEFKAQPNGGTIWAATNQCAGGGSACTNALYRMLVATRGTTNSVRSDSICFSIAIDGQTASLHVHWHDDGANSFYLMRIRYYLLFEVSGVKNLKRDVDSIIKWGLGTRLSTIKSALDTFIARAREIEAAAGS